jgi:adenylate kinase family enzyme
MKVAIAGQMASGKTTLAKALAEALDGTIMSLGGKVKDVGRDLFGMQVKDRPLLQQIGMKMREIRSDVWIEYLDRAAESSETQVVLVDDCRFINEAEWFKRHGWILIRLNIDPELQKSRLKETYPDDWQIHWNNRGDSSETEVPLIPAELVDFEIQAENSDRIIDNLLEAVRDYHS